MVWVIYGLALAVVAAAKVALLRSDGLGPSKLKYFIGNRLCKSEC